MGGAYSGLAEGAEGIPFNAAAASQRNPYSTTRTDYDINGGITFPALGREHRLRQQRARRLPATATSSSATVGGLVQHDTSGIGSDHLAAELLARHAAQLD